MSYVKKIFGLIFSLAFSIAVICIFFAHESVKIAKGGSEDAEIGETGALVRFMEDAYLAFGGDPSETYPSGKLEETASFRFNMSETASEGSSKSNSSLDKEVTFAYSKEATYCRIKYNYTVNSVAKAAETSQKMHGNISCDIEEYAEPGNEKIYLRINDFSYAVSGSEESDAELMKEFISTWNSYLGRWVLFEGGDLALLYANSALAMIGDIAENCVGGLEAHADLIGSTNSFESRNGVYTLGEQAFGDHVPRLLSALGGISYPSGIFSEPYAGSYTLDMKNAREPSIAFICSNKLADSENGRKAGLQGKETVRFSGIGNTAVKLGGNVDPIPANEFLKEGA